MDIGDMLLLSIVKSIMFIVINILYALNKNYKINMSRIPNRTVKPKRAGTKTNTKRTQTTTKTTKATARSNRTSNKDASTEADELSETSVGGVSGGGVGSVGSIVSNTIINVESVEKKPIKSVDKAQLSVESSMKPPIRSPIKSRTKPVESPIIDTSRSTPTTTPTKTTPIIQSSNRSVDCSVEIIPSSTTLSTITVCTPIEDDTDDSEYDIDDSDEDTNRRSPVSEPMSFAATPPRSASPSSDSPPALSSSPTTNSPNTLLAHQRSRIPTRDNRRGPTVLRSSQQSLSSQQSQQSSSSQHQPSQHQSAIQPSQQQPSTNLHEQSIPDMHRLLTQHDFIPKEKIIGITSNEGPQNVYVRCITKYGHPVYVWIDEPVTSVASDSDLRRMETDKVSAIPYSVKMGAFRLAGDQVYGVVFNCHGYLCVLCHTPYSLEPKELNYVSDLRDIELAPLLDKLLAYPLVRLSEIHQYPGLVLENVKKVTRKIRNHVYQTNEQAVKKTEVALKQLVDTYNQFTQLSEKYQPKLSDDITRLEYRLQERSDLKEKDAEKYNQIVYNLQRRNEMVEKLLRIYDIIGSKWFELNQLNSELAELNAYFASEFQTVGTLMKQ